MWTDLVTVPATASPIFSFLFEGLSGGTYYQFTILAENIQGWGSESPILVENAADQPNKPDVIVTSTLGTSIKVRWEPPNNNFKTITEYLVTIKDKGTGIFAENKSLCNGGSPDVVANTVCYISMKSLRIESSDYDYLLGDIP